MAIKTYKVNDFWLDIDKENHVDIESTDGVITSVKNNGEDIGGGGGSSDFSTATLTLNGKHPPIGQNLLPTLLVDPEHGLAGAYGSTNWTSSPYTVILYKGKAYAVLPQGTTSGGIVYDEEMEVYVITGDCTITIS